MAFALQRPRLVAHLRVAGQAVEQDQPVHADTQRRLRLLGAIALDVLLHFRQRSLGLDQPGVFAFPVGQAPVDQLGHVVGLQPRFLVLVEQVGTGLVKPPGAMGVADVAQGQDLQLVQQVVVGLAQLRPLDRCQCIDPACLVTVVPDLGEPVGARDDGGRRGRVGPARQSGAGQADAQRQRTMNNHETP